MLQSTSHEIEDLVATLRTSLDSPDVTARLEDLIREW